MVRAICLMGLTALFLTISPKLRDNVVDGAVQVSNQMTVHSPYSYVGLGVAVFGLLLFYLSRASAPR